MVLDKDGTVRVVDLQVSCAQRGMLPRAQSCLLAGPPLAGPPLAGPPLSLTARWGAGWSSLAAGWGGGAAPAIA